MSGVYTAVAAIAVNYQQGRKAQKEAQRQHDQTMKAQAKAEEEAKLYDQQAAIDTKTSEGATTDYGTPKKKKQLTANDLLVRPKISTASGSLGLGFDY